MASRHRFALLLLVAAALTPPCAAAQPQGCKLIRVDEWPLRPYRYIPTIDGEINGQKIGIGIDTGLTKSALLLRSAAARLQLPAFKAQGLDVAGVGGESEGEIAIVDELKIGEAKRGHWRTQVAGEQDYTDYFDLLLGHRFFQNIDFEFDLPNKTIRLFQPKDCDGVALAYWAKQGAFEAPIEIDDYINLTVQINGQPVKAILDSGAGRTSLDMALAQRLGISPKTPGVVPGGCVYGFGPSGVETWIAQFDAIAIGNELIRNPKLHFFDRNEHIPVMRSVPFGIVKYQNLSDLILGADFLHSHRVLVARSQRKLYFTHSGGTVFPAHAGESCTSEARGR